MPNFSEAGPIIFARVLRSVGRSLSRLASQSKRKTEAKRLTNYCTLLGCCSSEHVTIATNKLVCFRAIGNQGHCQVLGIPVHPCRLWLQKVRH